MRAHRRDQRGTWDKKTGPTVRRPPVLERPKRSVRGYGSRFVGAQQGHAPLVDDTINDFVLAVKRSLTRAQ